MYILSAKGKLRLFSTMGTTLCKYVFLTREDAESYIPTFRKSVVEIQENSLTELVDNKQLSIRVIELQVYKHDQV